MALLGPKGLFLNSLFKGDNFIPTILFLTELPKASLPSINLGLTFRSQFYSLMEKNNNDISAVIDKWIASV